MTTCRKRTGHRAMDGHDPEVRNLSGTTSASSRSVVYLADPAKYSGGDVELLGKGSTPEGLTKSWAAKMPR